MTIPSKLIAFSLIVLIWSFPNLSFAGFGTVSSAPTITGFSPSEGASGTVVTITGTNLGGATSIMIGNVPATIVSQTPRFGAVGTSLQAVVGPESSTGPIIVTLKPTLPVSVIVFGGSSPSPTPITAPTPAVSPTPVVISTAGTTLGNSLVPGNFESLCDPRVDETRSIAINDPSVINDPVRTVGPNGHWSFNFILSQLAPSTLTTSAFIKKWLLNFKNSTLSSDPAGSLQNSWVLNTGAVGTFLGQWPRTSAALEFDGTPPLDLTSNQFQLMAIMIRPDLTGNCTNCAGEARFVFKNIHSSLTSIDEVIFEFGLPISVGIPASPTWANWHLAMHDLSTTAFPSAAYNTRLQAFTDLFALKTFAGVSGLVNGSAIDQVRVNTNNFDSDPLGPFVLKEFHLTPTSIVAASGMMAASAGELVTWSAKNVSTNSFSPNVMSELLDPDNQPGFLAETFFTLPLWWTGRAVTTTAAGVAGYTIPRFTAAMSLRKAYDMNTCNGCHSTLVNVNGNAPGMNSLTTNVFSNLQVQPCTTAAGTALTSGSCFSSFLTGQLTGGINPATSVRSPAMVLPSAGPFDFSSTNWVVVKNYSDIDSRAANLLNKIINPTSGGSLNPQGTSPNPNGFCK